MKTLKTVALLILTVFLMTGCSTYKAYTFDVETGDSVKVKLETSSGYDISLADNFNITKNGEIVSNGSFEIIEDWDQAINDLKQHANTTAFDEGSKNGAEYFFAEYNSAFYHFVKISSKTAVALKNEISQESAKECFDLLTFTKE